MKKKNKDKKINRIEFLRSSVRYSFIGLFAVLSGRIFLKKSSAELKGEDLVWQIDPAVCMKCGKCATECVLSQSAVKCIHSFPICGYCKLCFGYFQPGTKKLNKSAENQICPTGAIKRKFVEQPYHEYSIDEELCNGCGKCVKGCNLFGNGSLSLQVRHDRCLNCNECSIAKACPSGAYKRVPQKKSYIKKESIKWKK